MASREELMFSGTSLTAAQARTRGEQKNGQDWHDPAKEREKRTEEESRTKKESEKARGVKQACSVILKVKKKIRVGES